MMELLTYWPWLDSWKVSCNCHFEQSLAVFYCFRNEWVGVQGLNMNVSRIVMTHQIDSNWHVILDLTLGFGYWAKDFMFLVHHDTEGMESWINSYHQPMSQNSFQPGSSDPIRTHSGIIQQAINFEFCGSDNYTGIGINYGKFEWSRTKL